MSVIISVYSYQTSLSFLSGQKNLFHPTMCIAFTLTDFVCILDNAWEAFLSYLCSTFQYVLPRRHTLVVVWTVRHYVTRGLEVHLVQELSNHY